MSFSGVRGILSKNNRGFTLVELVIVTGIVGMLAGIAIPKFQKSKAKSRSVEARLLLGNLYMAETAFFAENSSYISCQPINLI